jgi:hypothetical protein
MKTIWANALRSFCFSNLKSHISNSPGARAVRVLITVLLAAVFAVSAAAQSLPTPEEYLGFRVGTDKKLATWPQVVEYMHMAARASDRVQVAELGKSTMGHPFLLMTISAPENLARLEQIKADQRRLAYPYDLDEKAAASIAAENPAVILITLTIHSTEIGSTQMSLELVHRLATERSPYIDYLLKNVVFLLAPSVNPDGQVLVIDWYNKNVNTEFEASPMPWLYHKYVGHDNNRDAYMLTQVETQYVTKILYEDWFPLVFLDEHQMGSGGARIFVPPFVDPVNPNIDPAVVAGSNLMGMYMFNALNSAGKEGVIYGQRFTWWWQGSAKNGAWYHNMIGLLTEVASARVASPIEQQRAELFRTPPRRAGGEEEGGGGQADAGGAGRPLPPPNDTWPRTEYPRPWLGGTWRLRDIIDYELIITYALLEGAAHNREALQTNFYRLNRKAIAAGREGNPFAWVVPMAQHDGGAAARMLGVLHKAGIEIYRAKAAFEAGGRKFSAGSFVIPMAQPFRNYAKDLLEPQRYPMRPTQPGEAPERPYDVTGWTLPLQMGVDAQRIDRPFTVEMEKLTSIPKPEGDLALTARGGAQSFVIAPGPNSKSLLTNRLLKAGAEVSWVTQMLQAGTRGWRYPAGSLIVRGVAADKLKAMVAEHGLVGEQLMPADESALRGKTMKLRAPRIALYQPWVANMDEGWTRWLLEQYEFPYTSLHNEDIRAGNLSEKFDVIVFASQSKNGILNGARGQNIRPEYRGGLGREGSRAIEQFVRAGGTLVTLDSAADFAIDELGLPVRNVLRGVPADKFYCPGAVLEIFVDNEHPVAYGMPPRASAYFRNSPAFELTAPFSTSTGRAVARYPATNPLQSGWIGGPEHIQNALGAVEVSYGKGRVVLLGFQAQFRAQPDGTFKLLFNALHWAAAEPRTQ